VIIKEKRAAVLKLSKEALADILFRGSTWEGAIITNIISNYSQDIFQIFVRDDDNPDLPATMEGSELCECQPQLNTEIKLGDIYSPWEPAAVLKPQYGTLVNHNSIFGNAGPGITMTGGTITLPPGKSLRLPFGSTMCNFIIAGTLPEGGAIIIDPGEPLTTQLDVFSSGHMIIGTHGDLSDLTLEP